jgi:hypothetical protein
MATTARDTRVRLRGVVVGLLVSVALTTAAMADQFCDGYERGYATGYKRASGSSLDPLAPLCPLQPLKRLNDPESDFEQGYVIGFEQGMMEGHRR